MRKFKTLEDWIREALADSDKEKPCSAMACIYHKMGGGTKEVHSIKIAGKTWNGKDLAALFQGKAEMFAQDLGGIQSFEMQAFYGESEPQASHPFKIIDGEVSIGGANRVVRETPDGAGIVAQSMRHTEKAMELMCTMVQQTSVMAAQREARWYAREEELQTEVTESYKIIREMLMEKVGADHEMRMKEMEFARKAATQKELLGMVPPLLNQISGKEVFPQATSDTALLDAIAEKVKPEFLEQLGMTGVIPPALMGPLSMRLTEALKRKEAERVALAKVPPSHPDPSQDAQGGTNGLS
jgi:hypothetical protein